MTSKKEKKEDQDKKIKIIIISIAILTSLLFLCCTLPFLSQRRSDQKSEDYNIWLDYYNSLQEEVPQSNSGNKQEQVKDSNTPTPTNQPTNNNQNGSQNQNNVEQTPQPTVLTTPSATVSNTPSVTATPTPTPTLTPTPTSLPSGCYPTINDPDGDCVEGYLDNCPVKYGETPDGCPPAD
jgi:cytoskeletal protein RodZ